MAIFNIAIQENLPNALALVARRMEARSWVSLIDEYAIPIQRIRGWFTGYHPIQASHWSHFSDLQRRVLPRTETLCPNPQFTFESIHEVPIKTWLKKTTGRGVERTSQ
jgi:hypothetical protein